MKNFSEIAKTAPLFPDIPRMEMAQLMNKKIEFLQAEFLPSSFGGEFAVVLFKLDGKSFSTAIGSKVIVDSLKKYRADLPFEATVSEKKSKDGRMYQCLI